MNTTTIDRFARPVPTWDYVGGGEWHCPDLDGSVFQVTPASPALGYAWEVELNDGCRHWSDGLPTVIFAASGEADSASAAMWAAWRCVSRRFEVLEHHLMMEDELFFSEWAAHMDEVESCR